MTNIDPTPAMIADAAIRLQYNDITTDAELLDFAYCISTDDTPIRDALISAIDLDLNDMIHNMNLDFYLTLAELDALSDDEYELLADRLLDRTDPELIADKLLAIHTDLFSS